MVKLICETRPVARKHHRCWHCSRWIAPGARYRRAFLVYDGGYHLNMHEDCESLWQTYFVDADLYDSGEGFSPLIEDWRGSGEFETLCNDYRGLFPHAVTRLEWWAQKVEIARADRLREYGRSLTCSS